MAIRKIMELGEECLRKVCRPVEKFDSRTADLLDDLAETMYEFEGVGLAAPQVGILRRMVVIDTGEGLFELINPKIIEKSGEQTGPEGCLSIPGQSRIVTRPMHVVCEAQDRDGKTFRLTGEGLLARAICHELDHLDGVLYIDLSDEEPEYDA